MVKSNEITSGCQLLVIFAYFHFFGERLIKESIQLFVFTFAHINMPFDDALGVIAWQVLNRCTVLFLWLAGLLMVATTGSIVAQTGIVLATGALRIKGDKLDPVSNIRQIFSLKSLIELLKSCIKVCALCLTFFFIFSCYATNFQFLVYCSPDCALPVFDTLTRSLWAGMLLFYLVLCGADYAFQKYNALRQQKMSKEEVKQENKDNDGDPEIKKRRRDLHRELQSGSLARNVRQSTVVVRNPTHLAVCMGYDAQAMPLPRVVEKGRGGRARQMVVLAERYGIPVVENIPLARALFREVSRGECIPESLFEPVAALLRVVLDIRYDDEPQRENAPRNGNSL